MIIMIIASNSPWNATPSARAPSAGGLELSVRAFQVFSGGL